jgi:hypothetical protein
MADASESRWNLLARRLVVGLSVVAFAACTLILMGSQKLSSSQFPLLVLLLPIFVGVILLHELGHVLAAAAVGSMVLGLSVGPVGIMRRRRGLRVIRIHRSQAAGYAFIIPDFSRDVRRQVLIYVVGGPAANLITGLVALALTWPIQHHDATHSALFAFAVLSLLIGLANLVPVVATHHSDGAAWLHWWRNDSFAQRSFRIMKMYAYSFRGVLASEVPSEEIAALDADEDAGVRLFASYIGLRAAQQRGDMDAFDAIFERCAANVRALESNAAQRMRPLWTCVQIEREFECICAGGRAGVDVDPDVLKQLSPILRYRFAAAHAKAVGDAKGLRAMLAKARREAHDSFDVATRLAEPLLLDRLERSAIAPSIDTVIA